MTTIVTRSGKGSPLTNTEVDANFTSLGQNKAEIYVSSTTSASAITPANVNSQYNITALATDVTINAVSGAVVDGQKLIIRIKDNGTARNINWDPIYRNLGASLPSVTVPLKVMYIGLIYDSAESKWDCTSVLIQQ